MRPLAYLYFALTFLLGIIAGSAGTYYYAWNRGYWHRRFDKEQIVQHLRHELNLSDTQVKQVSQIVSESMQKFTDLKNQVEPQFAALREDGCNRIRQILSPEQVSKFNELVRRHEERRKKCGFP